MKEQSLIDLWKIILENDDLARAEEGFDPIWIGVTIQPISPEICLIGRFGKPEPKTAVYARNGLVIHWVGES